MIKIGEFSKLVQVPVATLRYYDQVGLLKPVAVDRFTGYRYYSASQLPRLHRILALKGLGFSLEQIAGALDEGLTPEQMRGMLRLRHAQISQQLADIQNQLQEVEGRLRQIEQEDNLPHYDILLKHVEPQMVASVRAVLPNHESVGQLYGEVYAEIGTHVHEALGAHPGEGGTTLVLWYDMDFKAHNVDGAAAFFLRCPVPDSGRMRCHMLPAATMAATVHHGSYNTINQAHEAILRWIETNGYHIVGADREINLYNTHPIRQDDPTYVTEIQYPVEKLGSTRSPDLYPIGTNLIYAQGEPYMMTEPKIEERAEQPYVAIRRRVKMSEMPALPQQWGVVMNWLNSKGISPTGAPFWNYRIVDMVDQLEIDVGFPIAQAVTGEGEIIADSFPSGRYVTSVYTGRYDDDGLMRATGELLAWAEKNGVEWDKWQHGATGEGWRARAEIYLTDPDQVEDPNQNQTQLVFKIK